ncbi:Rapid ALkalinization Factor [Macleaya cordata]|uniref:Rapid ALkalinization Factor n=1 Tax=Macleaya cordata TaxID=56857 RepID=A0A200QHW5_MACCD|nr:Rapid ALkalinization Factor [Macleaya cordata]
MEAVNAKEISYGAVGKGDRIYCRGKGPMCGEKPANSYNRGCEKEERCRNNPVGFTEHDLTDQEDSEAASTADPQLKDEILFPEPVEALQQDMNYL